MKQPSGVMKSFSLFKRNETRKSAKSQITDGKRNEINKTNVDCNTIKNEIE